MADAERAGPPLSRGVLEGALAKARALRGVAPSDVVQPVRTPAPAALALESEFVDLGRVAVPPATPVSADTQPVGAQLTPKEGLSEFSQWEPTPEEAKEFAHGVIREVVSVIEHTTLDKDVTVGDVLHDIATRCGIPDAPTATNRTVIDELVRYWNKAVDHMDYDQVEEVAHTDEWEKAGGDWNRWIQGREIGLGKEIFPNDDAFEELPLARELRTHEDFRGLSPEVFTRKVRSLYHKLTDSGLIIKKEELEAEIRARMTEREQQLLPELEQQLLPEIEAEVRRKLEEERARAAESGGSQELPENVRRALAELHPLVRVLRSVDKELDPDDIYALVEVAQEEAGVAPDNIIRTKEDYNSAVERLLAELPEELAYSFRLTFQAYGLNDLAPKEQ